MERDGLQLLHMPHDSLGQRSLTASYKGSTPSRGIRSSTNPSAAIRIPYLASDLKHPLQSLSGTTSHFQQVTFELTYDPSHNHASVRCTCVYTQTFQTHRPLQFALHCTSWKYIPYYIIVASIFFSIISIYNPNIYPIIL